MDIFKDTQLIKRHNRLRTQHTTSYYETLEQRPPQHENVQVPKEVGTNTKHDEV